MTAWARPRRWRDRTEAVARQRARPCAGWLLHYNFLRGVRYIYEESSIARFASPSKRIEALILLRPYDQSSSRGQNSLSISQHTVAFLNQAQQTRGASVPYKSLSRRSHTHTLYLLFHIPSCPDANPTATPHTALACAARTARAPSLARSPTFFL